MQGDVPGQKSQEGLLSGAPLPSAVVAAAHELKNPLSLIRQLSLMLDDELILSDDHRRLLRQIRLTSERSLRTVTSVTRAARLEDSLFALEPINPQQLCEQIAYELGPLYEQHGKSIRVRRHRRAVLAVANPELLRRIVTSFVDNALRFGQVDHPVEVRASLNNRGRTVRINVRDYGPHLSVHAWRALDQTIGRVPQPLPARPDGSGLGLHLAGQFAAAMNGKIGAIRHRNGMSFYVDVAASTQLSLL